MAVVVRIQINRDEPLHVLEIRRISDTEQAVLDPDTVCEYVVTDYADNGRQTYIEHRYGDDVALLAIKALETVHVTSALPIRVRQAITKPRKGKYAPTHSVRVEETLWALANTRANAEGRTLSDVMHSFIEGYSKQKITLPIPE